MSMNPGYVYIHKQNNVPFYVGIGIDNKPKYARAYRKCSRSKEWWNIVNNGGYQVEIFLDNLTLDQAAFIEKWLIATYGRKDKNTGILVNHTNGGIGCPEPGSEKKKAAWTPEKRALMSQKMKKPKVAGTGEKIRQALTGGKHSKVHNHNKPILQCDLNGNIIKEWCSNDEAAKSLKMSKGGISSCCTGNQHTAGGFKWRYK